MGKKRSVYQDSSKIMWLTYSGLIVLSALVAILICSYYSTDSVGCTITNADVSKVNGYYVAEDGIYYKVGHRISYIPDAFVYFYERYSLNDSPTALAFYKGFWYILNTKDYSIIYFNPCYIPSENADQIMDDCLHHPPSNYWYAIANSTIPYKQHKYQKSVSSLLTQENVISKSITVKNQFGKLENSFSSWQSGSSNMGNLLENPMNSLILTIIFIVAYYLWAYNLDVSLISYSYEKVVLQKEYFRIITASLSHVDVLHLLFNTMTLYQLGSLEGIYGSLTYGYLSILLIFLTMFICILIDYILIHQYQQQQQITQQAIGYSCVLFAWMVALSVRMSEYCPIFVFPTFCIKTWYIPLGSVSLPVNVGPFLLLFFTKLIIPRSSFYGHLSGILIGYPLAWNLLNYITPCIYFSIFIMIYHHYHQHYVWKIPGYSESTIAQLGEFVNKSLLYTYYIWIVISCLIGLYASIITFYTMDWYEQFLPRLVTIYFMYAGINLKRIEWYSTSYNVQELCAHLLLVSMVWMTAMFLYDIMNCIIAVNAHQMLLSTSQIYSNNHWHRYTIGLMSIGIILEFGYLLCLYYLLSEVPYCERYWSWLGLEKQRFLQYLQYCKFPTIAFSGRSYRLSSGSDSSATADSSTNSTSTTTGTTTTTTATTTTTTTNIIRDDIHPTNNEEVVIDLQSKSFALQRLDQYHSQDQVRQQMEGSMLGDDDCSVHSTTDLLERNPMHHNASNRSGNALKSNNNTPRQVHII
jgi:membrane associated rhomboid family serine protease